MIYKGIAYNIERGKSYNFYGDEIVVCDLGRFEQGFVGFTIERLGCKMFNACQVEEFAKENPETVLGPVEA